MSSPLSIQAAPPIRGLGDSTAPSRGAVPAPAPSTKPVPLFVNPSFQFDPTVAMVVIDFHDDKGAVSSSIPSQRQLEAYRAHRETPPGQQAPQAAKASPPADGKTAAR